MKNKCYCIKCRWNDKGECSIKFPDIDSQGKCSQWDVD